MASNCFDGFIGIKGCDATSGSGYFIQDLEGITIRKASSVANDNYATGEALLRAKIDFACKLVVDEFRLKLNPMFRIDTLTEARFVGDYKTGFEGPAALERGLRIQRNSGPLSRTRIESVTVRANTVGPHVLKITDGPIETTYDFEVVTAGVDVVVRTEYRADERDVYVTVDNTAFDPAVSKLKNSGCACGGRRILSMFTVYGWSGTANSGKTYGLKAEIMADCDVEHLFCLLKSRMALPILYRAGVEIMREAAESDRLNYYTLVEDRDAALDKADDWIAEYNKRLETAVSGVYQMAANIDENCVKCNHTHYVEALP